MTEQERDTSFKDIFRRNYVKLFRYALYVIGNNEDARDIVSEVFRKLLEDYSTILLSTVDPWLFICVKTKCLDYLRHQKRVNELAQSYFSGNEVTSDTFDEYDRRLDAVLQIIDSLPQKSKRVMELCYLEDMSYKEAANVLGLQPSGIKKHILKSLQTIRRQLNVNYKKGQAPKTGE